MQALKFTDLDHEKLVEVFDQIQNAIEDWQELACAGGLGGAPGESPWPDLPDRCRCADRGAVCVLITASSWWHSPGSWLDVNDTVVKAFVKAT
jgi:hypothetical protein